MQLCKQNEALKYKIPNIIEFDKEIGGRYSIWSEISFAAHFANDDELKKKFILGGRQADQDLKNDKKYFDLSKTYLLVMYGFITLKTNTIELFFHIYGNFDHCHHTFNNLKWNHWENIQ